MRLSCQARTHARTHAHACTHKKTHLQNFLQAFAKHRDIWEPLSPSTWMKTVDAALDRMSQYYLPSFTALKLQVQSYVKSLETWQETAQIYSSSPYSWWCFETPFNNHKTFVQRMLLLPTDLSRMGHWWWWLAATSADNPCVISGGCVSRLLC